MAGKHFKEYLQRTYRNLADYMIYETLTITRSGSDSGPLIAVLQPDKSKSFPYAQTLKDEPVATSSPLNDVSWSSHAPTIFSCANSDSTYTYISKVLLLQY